MSINILKIKKIKFLIILGLIFIQVSVLIYLNNELFNLNFLKIVYFDIGQGDSVFIKLPEGYKILVDAGPNDKIINKIKKELPFYDKTIDLIIPTHSDADHISGFLNLLDSTMVKSALITGHFSNTETYKSLIQKIEKNNIKIIKAIAGAEILIGDKAKIEIINPFEDIELQDVKNENNYGIAFILTYGQRKFLFTADIETQVEKELITKLATKLNVDILKTAHHGSRTSSSIEFLKATSPGISIVQVGKNNKYGHPHLETLENLKPSIILRNDIVGDITLYSDGKKIWLK